MMSAVTASICALAAHAAAHLGQDRVALNWLDRVDAADIPLLVADVAYMRGMVHRQLGAGPGDVRHGLVLAAHGGGFLVLDEHPLVGLGPLLALVRLRHVLGDPDLPFPGGFGFADTAQLLLLGLLYKINIFNLTMPKANRHDGSLVKAFGVSPGTGKSHRLPLGSGLDAVDQQEIASNVAFPERGLVAFERVIRPFWTQGTILGDQEQHGLFQPFHFEPAGADQTTR